MHDTENFKKNIHEDYDIEEELGSGQFAVVRKIVEKETGDEFAAKYVRKKRTKASRNGMSREDIKREIEILRMVDSEKIIKVHDVYETDKEMILVMELLRGGELFDYISKKDFLTEEEAIDFTRQILLGLQHLHSRSVVHLDLKPENILLKNTRRKTIKLVDFGLARVVNENEQVREIMGTPEFVAPEVLNFDTISTATDMWALGVIAYILLSGASPFLGEDNQETFTNIIQVDYQFDEEYFDEISDEAKDFIRKLLVKNPRKRPTAHDCSRHPWVEEEVVDKKKRQRRRTTQICTFNFKRFVARKRWKMSYNKIRAMNLIAKMGIKPPPGFITAIPPMGENNNEIVEPEPVEEKPSSHKEHKKKESTIHRKKHKQASSPKATVEKTDSLTLKTMDIDIGEVKSVEPEPEPEPGPMDGNEASEKVESSPPPEEPTEPINYGTMTKREKRRARGQLRMDEIEKSKKEIDEKHAKLDTDQVVNGDETAGDAPAMDVQKTAPDDEKPAEPQTVTSTMHIEHKPVTNTPSNGILKKSKARRIPSTEDHYFVTLNAALLQQDDAFYPSASSGLQPTRQHGILKHTTALPRTSDETTKNSEENATQSKDVPKGSKIDASKVSDVVPESPEDVPKPIENKKVSEFTVVQVNNAQKDDNLGNAALESLEKRKTVAHEPDWKPGNKSKEPKAEVKPSNKNSDATPKNTAHVKEATPAPKKPLTKTDHSLQQRGFTPPPWQRKSSKENMKTNPQPLHGVSKVSLKANRFLSNDKQTNPKLPTNSGPAKASNVLGKSKIFQKEASKPDGKKTEVNKTYSGQELKNVSCDISLDDTAVKNVESSVTKPLAESKMRSDSQSKVTSHSELKPQSNGQLKVLADGQSKPRSNSQSKPRSGSIQATNKNSNEENTSNTSRSRSNSNQKNEGKVVNGENATETKNGRKSSGVLSLSSVEVSGGHEEEESGADVGGGLVSTSTHSLTEFTIRPHGNSGEEKTFDIMLTVGSPADEPSQESRLIPQEPRAVSAMKTRFTSSSSSLPDPRSGLPNGRLTSLSTNDVTSLNREPVLSPTGDRHVATQGAKYTPQRDFSKYLNNDPLKSVKTTGVPANTQNPQWQVKRNNPPTATVTPTKTVITPKSSTTPATRPASVVAKSAAAKVTVAVPKGKKSAITTTAYIPRRSFGFSTKAASQSAVLVKPLEPKEAPKLNNNDESKRWSQTSYSSDRSGSSVSSDEMSVSNVNAENNGINRATSNEQIGVKNPEIPRKIENHSENLSPVLQRKWKATLLLSEENEKVPTTKERDIRISSSNAPRKNKFTNVRSMWEGK